MLASIRRQRLAALSFALLLAFALVVGTAGDAGAAGKHHKPHKAGKHHRAGKHHHATKHHRRKVKRKHQIRHAVKVAKQQKGDPYRYGANGPGSFDCSGLTQYAYQKAHVKLPRTSSAQYRKVRHIKKKHLRKGDPIFFYSGHGHVYHVGLYWGKNPGHKRVLHAPYSGSRVRVNKIWTHQYKAGTLRRK